MKSDKPLLLVFSPLYSPSVGGLQNHAEQFNREFVKRGYGVTVFTPMIAGGASYETTNDGVEVYRFPAFELIPNWPAPKLWSPTFWKQLRLVVNKADEAKSSKLKAIMISRTRFFSTSLLALVIAKTRRLTWLHIEHGSDYVQLNNPLFKFLARIYDHTIGWLVFQCADHVVANSHASASFVRMIANRTATVIYRGVDVEKISSVESANIRDQYQLPENIKIITYAGRLIDGKGVHNLLYAIQQIKLLISNFQLLIVGGGPRKGDFERLVRELGIADQVTFLGEKSWEETIAVLKATDVFVNPSYTEGLPSSVIEAQLSGCRTIATDVGGTKEIDEVVLIRPRDVSALTSELQSVLSENSAPVDTTLASRFSWEVAVNSYETIINE